jgi:hypothetical protein
MTTAIPERAGSVTSRRVRTPSVTTTIFVFAQLGGDPARRGPRRHAARLEQPESPLLEEPGLEERDREARRLSGAGRRDDDEARLLP